MSNGVVALFGIIKQLSGMRSIESLARTFNMPYVSTTAPSSYLYATAAGAAVQATSSSYLSPAAVAAAAAAASPSSFASSHAGSVRNRTGIAPIAATTAFTLYLRPLYRKAIIDLVQYYGWAKVYYIYDNNEGIHSFTYLKCNAIMFIR